MARRGHLAAVPGGARESGVHRRLMTAVEISHEIFRGKKSPEWVRKNVPGKITLGHSSVMWYEDDVWAFIESCRTEGSS